MDTTNIECHATCFVTSRFTCVHPFMYMLRPFRGHVYRVCFYQCYVVNSVQYQCTISLKPFILTLHIRHFCRSSSSVGLPFHGCRVVGSTLLSRIPVLHCSVTFPWSSTSVITAENNAAHVSGQLTRFMGTAINTYDEKFERRPLMHRHVKVVVCVFNGENNKNKLL